MKKIIICLLFLLTLCLSNHVGYAQETLSQKDIYAKRMELYQKGETIYGVPWYYFAAMDQYDRNVRRVRKDIPKKENGVLSFFIRPEFWYGVAPNNEKLGRLPFSLGGIGVDGNDDGIADPNNDADLIATVGTYLSRYGTSDEQLLIAFWDYYKRDLSVGHVSAYSKIYHHYGKLDLENHRFIMPLYSIYTIQSSYGAARSFGGRRMHEGVDIFAPHGVPVRSASYGIIEIKGWNRLGGWRIGIRDLHNNYHYYAHLGGFAKDISVGSIVEPGTVIGFVGSSGYGTPGTSGKFPPHLHYGIYKDNGRSEWPFDPYYYLKSWEREERKYKK